MTKVTVSRYWKLDVLTDDIIYSRRKATDERIAEMQADAMPGSSEEVDEADLGTSDEDRGHYPAETPDRDSVDFCPVSHIPTTRSRDYDRVTFENDVTGRFTLSGTAEAVLNANKRLIVGNGLRRHMVDFVKENADKAVLLAEDFTAAGLLPPFDGPNAVEEWNAYRKKLGLWDGMRPVAQ